MTHPLLLRLNSIGERLSTYDRALALLALGSVGLNTDRLDEHSDLDFFVIATDKDRFLTDLDWLGKPLEWCHRNTPDGFQALVGSVFHEFAVFEPAELAGIPFQPGRVVWSRLAFDVGRLAPSSRISPGRGWVIDEVLANLHVGLHRWLRGERLSAMRKVQGAALDALLRLTDDDDPFDPTRRAEERLNLPWANLASGYQSVPAAARSIFAELPPGTGAMRQEVEALLVRAEQVNSEC